MLTSSFMELTSTQTTRLVNADYLFHGALRPHKPQGLLGTGVMLTTSFMELYAHTIHKAFLGPGVMLTSSFMELYVHTNHKACYGRE